jgi:hypothetical protein
VRGQIGGQIGHAEQADRTRGARSNASLADRNNPLSIGRFGPTCRVRVRRIVPHVERAGYAPSPRLVNGRSGATSLVVSSSRPPSAARLTAGSSARPRRDARDRTQVRQEARSPTRRQPVQRPQLSPTQTFPIVRAGSRLLCATGRELRA